jgi:3'(2'), 5'-bisphosphate nucleotidase
MNDKHMLLAGILAAVEAGDAILEVYRSDFEVVEKADKSPLTLADQRSHEIIVKMLSGFNIPILSEEGKNVPFSERKKWDTFWLIDPLDGTKEFIKKNGEFTVNIAVIRSGEPVAGVIYVPDKSILYFASKKIGAYRAALDQITGLQICKTAKGVRCEDLSDIDLAEKLHELISRSSKLPINEAKNQPVTIVGSRSHATAELEAFVEGKRKEFGDVEFISAGSSLKQCLVAEGRADIYPRTGPTMEWDTAAGQAIVESAGGRVIHFDTGESLVYNKENLLNPWFVVLR